MGYAEVMADTLAGDFLLILDHLREWDEGGVWAPAPLSQVPPSMLLRRWLRLRLCSGAQGCRGDEDRFR